MLHRLSPYVSGLRRRIGIRASEPDATCLHAAEVAEHPAIAALPGQRARVTATVGKNAQAHLAYFDGGPLTHAACERRTYTDAFVFANGFTAHGRNFNRLGQLDHRRLLTGPVYELPEAHYCMEDRAYHYFGHWLFCFSTALLAEDGAPILHTPDPTWSHAADYEAAFGLPAAKGMQFRVGRLHVYRDYALNASKRRRLHTLARRLKARFPPVPGAPRKIYLRRGASGVSRLVAGEETLITALQGEGFAVVDVEGIALADLMAALSGAEIVISVEGSHITHALFAMAEGGLLLVLNPADRFNAYHLARAAAFGLQPATLVMPRVEGGYGADPAEVLDTLALAQRPQTVA